MKFELVDMETTKGIHDPQFTVALWLIQDPVNIAWNQYLMNVVHLREEVQGKPTIFYRPGTTHEMFCYALDAAYKCTVDDISNWHALQPVNMAYQWESKNDAAAFEFIENLLQQAPSVDTDFRQWWTHYIVHVAGGISG